MLSERPTVDGVGTPKATLFRRTWIDLSLDIDAAPAQLFALLSDIDRWPSWTPGLLAIRRNTRKPVGVGTQFLMTLVFPWTQRMVLPCEVFVWRHDRLEWGRAILGSRVHHRFELHALPDGRTRLRHLEYAVGFLAVLLRPFEAYALNHDRAWSEAIQERFRRQNDERRA